jgi:predicted ATPase/DNA-binding CsgD family transcriptional regulator
VGEFSWPVPPLSVSLPADDQPTSHAVQLFAERACAIRPDFQLKDNAATVAELCTRLDGLPLAIELAAARTRTLPVRALLHTLQSATGGLPILTGGPRGMPERQRTLRATIAWSYDLLDPDEQGLFRRLAVFRGCTLDAITSVCIAAEAGPRATSVALPNLQFTALDGAASLVSKNLLLMDEDFEGNPRYTMLETVREFATAQLEASGEAAVVRRRHALFYMHLAEDVEPKLYGADQVMLLNRLEQEHPNLRQALDWCQAQGYVEPSLRLALGLWMFWATHSHVAEGSSRLESLLRRFPSGGSGDSRLVLRAQLCHAAGRLAGLEGDLVRARARLEESLALMEALEDTPGILNALEGLAALANQQGEFETSRVRLERAIRIAQAVGGPLRTANTTYHLGILALDEGNAEEARALLETCVTLYAEHGDPRSLGFTLQALGRVDQETGDLDRACARIQEALKLLEEFGDRRAIALALADLGSAHIARRDFANAYEHLVLSLRTLEEVGDQLGLATIVDRFGELAAAQGDAARALRLCGAAVALREHSAARLPTRAQARLDAKFASARRALGPTAEAAEAAGRALSRTAALDEALATMPHGRADGASPLSQREFEVAACVARGLTNREIAAELMIAEGTVASHIVHMLAKLGVASRAQVAVWAAERLSPRVE